MTCVKTGAMIYFRNYGMLVVGDAFQVGDTYIFRWNIHSIEYTSDSRATHVVETIMNSGVWWHRDDLGVTVVPNEYVSVYKDAHERFREAPSNSES